MAFNNAGPPTYLSAGSSVWWAYSWGADKGTQFASADIKTPNSGAAHLADNQRKVKVNSGTTYYVRITNQGPGGAVHNLQGGGMS